MRDSIPITDEELGFRELEQDSLYRKIPEPMKGFYVKESLQKGREAAGQWRGKRIQEALEEKGIEVVMKAHQSMAKMVRLRGEICFTKEKSSITVYEDSLQSMAEACMALPKGFSISREKCLEVHLAHEFFHYLEFEEGKTVAEKLPKAQIGKFFGWTRMASIQQSSEIAAHAFAKEMCGLKVLPNYYDMVYIERQREKKN